MRERIADYAAYISSFGLFLLLASLAGFVLARQSGTNMPDWLAPGLAISGLVLFVLGIILRPDMLRETLSRRQARYGTNALLLVIAAIGILAVLNFISWKYFRIWDLTTNKQFSVSNQTKQILDDLPQPVKLTALLTAQDQTTAEDLTRLVDQYKARSTEVSFEGIDPQLDRLKTMELAQRLTLDSVPARALIAESGGAHSVVYSFDEQSLTEAIVKATRPKAHKVYFTTGHGEHDPNGGDAQDGGYSGVKTALERDGYTVDTISLATITDTLTADDIVFVAGPKRPFLPVEAERLAKFVQDGGSVLLLADPQVTTGLEPVLLPWEIRLRDDLVLDPSRNLGGRINLVAVKGDGYQSHTITKDLGQFLSIFPSARSISTGAPVTGSLVTSPLVQTSPEAWGETSLGTLQEQQPQPGPGDETGPLVMAVAAEGGKDMGRLVVFGTSALASDGFLQELEGIANLDLVLNAVNWLAQDEVLIGIRPTESDDRPMQPPQNWGLLLLLTAIVLPLAALAIGTWIWWQRR